MSVSIEVIDRGRVAVVGEGGDKQLTCRETVPWIKHKAHVIKYHVPRKENFRSNNFISKNQQLDKILKNKNEKLTKKNKTKQK